MEKFITLGNKVRVSDPCYGTDTWCAGEVDNVLEGKYVVDIETSDEGMWGTRVKFLRAIHTDHADKMLLFCNVAPFEVGVDSGQAGIYDAEYYNKYHTVDDCDDDWYDDICNLTDPFGTKDDKCVVSSSGFGDGCYICYLAKDTTGKVVGFEIMFIDDEEEDEDDYYEEDYEEEDDEDDDV